MPSSFMKDSFRLNKRKIEFFAIYFAGAVVVLYQACQNPQFKSTSPLTSKQILNCTFNGREILDGEVILAYLNSTEDYGKPCQSQERSCAGGKLTGSYNFGSCDIAEPKACLFNGRTFRSGQTTEAFRNSAVAFGSVCEKEIRDCSNGILSGSFPFPTCEAGKPKNCLFDGKNVPHGTTVNAYAMSTVPFGIQCSPIARTCNDGALSGMGDYGSCVVNLPASCLFNGMTIPHGQNVLVYRASRVNYGQSCSAVTRTCENGALSGDGDFASCVVGAPASCLINGQTVPHGGTITLFLEPTVPNGSTCQTQLRLCGDGTLSGTAQFSACTVQAETAAASNAIWYPPSVGTFFELLQDKQINSLRTIKNCSEWDGDKNIDGVPPGFLVGNCTKRDSVPAGYSLRGLPDGTLDDTHRHWGLIEGYHVGPLTINGVSFPEKKDIMIYRIEANSVTTVNTSNQFVIEGFNNVGLSPSSPEYNSRKFRRVESNRNGFFRGYSNTKNEVRNIALNNGVEYAYDGWPHLYLEQNFKNWYDFMMFDSMKLDLSVRISKMTELSGWTGSYKDVSFLLCLSVRHKMNMSMIFVCYTPYSQQTVNYVEQTGIDQFGQGLYRGPVSDLGGPLVPGGPFRRIQIDVKGLMNRAILNAAGKLEPIENYALTAFGLGFESVGYHEYEFEVQNLSMPAILNSKFDQDVFSLSEYRSLNGNAVPTSSTHATRMHWLRNGSLNGLRGSQRFNSKNYLNRYPDLADFFGPSNYSEAINHFVYFGRSEGRNGN
ncbi:MAG: hypothetical protein K2X47_18545 [Bdellovibrionales bacterium]|nr:hypothetical protein [Bdellovibrionales bacterium]